MYFVSFSEVPIRINALRAQLLTLGLHNIGDLLPEPSARRIWPGTAGQAQKHGAGNLSADGEEREAWALNRRRSLSQNYDKAQNQDHEDQCARTHEYDFAHYIGLQQVFATDKTTSRKIGGR
jgi:hypothetical protein